jgi:hypothetical protein
MIDISRAKRFTRRMLSAKRPAEVLCRILNTNLRRRLSVATSVDPAPATSFGGIGESAAVADIAWGTPQWGQREALSLIDFPHSSHAIKAMEKSLLRAWQEKSKTVRMSLPRARKVQFCATWEGRQGYCGVGQRGADEGEGERASVQSANCTRRAAPSKPPERPGALRPPYRAPGFSSEALGRPDSGFFRDGAARPPGALRRARRLTERRRTAARQIYGVLSLFGLNGAKILSRKNLAKLPSGKKRIGLGV